MFGDRTARRNFPSRFCFDGDKSEERSLHCAGRLLRRSEAEKQRRWPASVGMTGICLGRKKSQGFEGDKERREIPPLRRPAASQERSRKAKAPACFGRDDRYCLGRKKSQGFEGIRRIRRPAPVGMTSVADGGKGAKILAASAMQMRRPASVGMTSVAASWRGREGLGDECGAVRGRDSWRGKICG